MHTNLGGARDDRRPDRRHRWDTAHTRQRGYSRNLLRMLTQDILRGKQLVRQNKGERTDLEARAWCNIQRTRRRPIVTTHSAVPPAPIIRAQSDVSIADGCALTDRAELEDDHGVVCEEDKRGV